MLDAKTLVPAAGAGKKGAGCFKLRKAANKTCKKGKSGLNLTELQKQILHDEMNAEDLSDYEKVRLNNMKERQAMLDSIDFKSYT